MNAYRRFASFSWCIALLGGLALAPSARAAAPNSPGQGSANKAAVISILTQPVSQTVTVGSGATLTVVADAPGNSDHLLRYQWKKDGANVGTNSPTLSIPSAQASDRGSYTVTITFPSREIVSQAATLAVNTPPVITAQPMGLTVDQGGTAAFSVTATEDAGGTLSYQWRKAGEPIAGATANTFAIQGVVASDAASYDVVITNTLNGTTTTTLSAAAVLLVHLPPAILTQPATRVVMPPDAVTFTVAAQANLGGTLTYQWKKNGTAITGATAPSYTVASTEFPTNGDSYAVTITDGTLSTESAQVNAIASVDSPVYAGNPLPVPARPLTVLNSLHVDPVNFPNGAFRLGYDESLKNPVWTSYVVFPVHQPYPNSQADYTADLRLEAPQVGKNDYLGIYTGGASSPTSYDRGHQVPRADVSYRYTPVAGDDATIMSNLVPQISQFNQQTWQRLEESIGGSQGGDTDGITSFKGRVWVYTGSVFPTGHAWWTSTITPGLKIGIPTACYKIVVSEPVEGQPKALAVLMPNTWGLVNSDSTLTGYVTSVARIEALTGLDFFPNLATKAPGLDIPTWKATVDVRGWRAPFEQATGPNVHMIQPSWDTTLEVNDTLTFEGAATPPAADGTATIASATWNFGDGSPSATGTMTSHTFTQGGSFNVTFTAQDNLGATNTVTRVVTVRGANEAPVLTGLSDQSGTSGTPMTVKFNVSDDRTAAGSVTLSVSVDDPTLLVGTPTISNVGGVCSLNLNPAVVDASKSTGITITALDADGASSSKRFTLTLSPAVAGFTEGFESSAKAAYAVGNVTLPSGVWTLDDALIGNTTSDRKNGTWSVRARNLAKVTMAFDVAQGAKTVNVLHAKYGADANSTWQLWCSVNGGAWAQVGADVTTSSTTLQAATFPVNLTGAIRFQIRKISGGSARINFDDFQVLGF